MPFVGRQTARGYGCRNGAAAGQLDRLKLLDLVKVLGQTRSKRRKRMRMRIELVSRLGGMDHGADAGIGQQLQEQRMRRSTVNDVGTKYAAGKRIEALAMRRAKVKDLKAANRFGDKPEDQEIALLAILTDLTPEDVQEMDLADYTQMQSSFRRLVGSGADAVADAGAAGAVVPVSA